METEAKHIQSIFQNDFKIPRTSYTLIAKKFRWKPINYSCPICCKIFQLPSALFVHFRRCKTRSSEDLKTKTETNELNCCICSKVYKTLGYLKTHMRTCTTTAKPKSMCTYCGKSFTEMYNLQQHIKKKHDKSAKPYICDLCGFQSVLLRNIEGHMKRRHLTKENICDICGKSFATMFELRPHMLIHSGQKKFKCDQCDKSYAQRSGLTIHRTQAHEKRVYACDLCALTFTTYMQFFLHNDIHKFPDGVKCENCEKNFKNRHFLALHRRSVHGRLKVAAADVIKEKKYKCPDCEYAAVAKHLLKAHIVKHTKAKPFSCEICGMKFGWRRAVKAHEKNQHSL